MKTQIKIILSLALFLPFLQVHSQVVTHDFQANLHVKHIQAVDENIVWAFGTTGFSSYDINILKRSENGNWSFCKSNGLDTVDRYYAFYAFDSLNAFIANSITVYRTSDGGDNWAEVISTWGTGFINDILFSQVDQDRGYILSDPVNGNNSPAPVFRTSDGGQTWDTVFMNYGQGNVGLSGSACLRGTDNIWIGGNGQPYTNPFPRVSYSSNAGSSWSFLSLPQNLPIAYYTQIDFKNDFKTGIILCHGITEQRLYRTTNNSLNWQNVFDYSVGMPSQLKWAENSDTWYMVQAGYLHKSTDDGITWPLVHTFNRQVYTLSISVNEDVVTGYIGIASQPGDIYRFVDTIKLVSKITQIGSEIPSGYELRQNYPNPFNPVTTISYDILEAGDVKLSVYDILGQEVAVLVNERQSAGSYNYQFSIDNYRLSSGVYFYRLKAGEFSDVKKMMLLK